MQGERQVTGDPIATRSPEDVRAVLEKTEWDQNAIEQIVRLHEIARSEKLSVKELAGLVHYSPAVVSELFNGTYKGNPVRVAKNIERMFSDRENKRIFGGKRDFVRTTIAESLWRIAEKTRYSRAIQIIQSPEQLGKSRALVEYTAQHNSGRTVMLKLQPGGNSNPFGVFLRDLAAAVGVEAAHDKIMDVRMNIRRELAGCDLVILDEFHLIEHWPDKPIRDLLDYLRVEIHNDGQRGVLAVATDSDMMTLLDGFRRRTRYNLGQLMGRMANQHTVTIRADEIPFDDVKLLIERYFKPRAATLRKLFDLACRPHCGHLGVICAIMADAWSDSQLDKIDLTDELVLSKAEAKLESLAKSEKGGAR